MEKSLNDDELQQIFLYSSVSVISVLVIGILLLTDTQL